MVCYILLQLICFNIGHVVWSDTLTEKQCGQNKQWDHLKKKKEHYDANHSTVSSSGTGEPECVIICDKSLTAHIYIKLIEFCLLCVTD